VSLPGLRDEGRRHRDAVLFFFSLDCAGLGRGGRRKKGKAVFFAGKGWWKEVEHMKKESDGCISGQSILDTFNALK